MGMSSASSQLFCDGSCGIMMHVRLLYMEHAALKVLQAMLLSCP